MIHPVLGCDWLAEVVSAMFSQTFQESSFIDESHGITKRNPEFSGIYRQRSGKGRDPHNMPLLRVRKSTIQCLLQQNLKKNGTILYLHASLMMDCVWIVFAYFPSLYELGFV